jgi:ABC-type nitrate/sulfonate/bicarbonate transport system substrate-binding protein
VIGVPAIGSEGQLVTKAMLEHAGLDSEKDVQYVAVGLAAGAIAQFKAGQIDAIVAVEPVARILINTAGGSVVYDMAVDDDVELLKAWNQGTYWGRPSTATQKADAFKKFQAGMDKAIAFVIDPKNTPEVAELWGAKLPAFDKAELVKVLEKNRDVYTTEVDCKAYSSGVDLAVNLGLVQTAQKKACRDTVWTESNQKVVE